MSFGGAISEGMPYVYQIAALVGFGHLLVSREFFTAFGEYMRFWYNFFYLVIALANIVAVNLYFAVSKKMWTLAKAWSAGVTFPTVFVSVFFVYNYGYLQGATFPALTLQLVFVGSIAILGVGISVLLSPDLFEKLRGRR